MTQAQITLNVTDVRSVMLFMHNKDHALLDFSDAFGGTYLSVPTVWRRDAPNSRVKTYITFALKVEIFNKIETEENVCQVEVLRFHFLLGPNPDPELQKG